MKVTCGFPCPAFPLNFMVYDYSSCFDIRKSLKALNPCLITLQLVSAV